MNWIGIPLSPWAIFAWGCLGGFVSFVIIFALPELRTAYGGSRSPSFSAWKVIVVLLILAAFTAVGGAAALLLGDNATNFQQAVVFGLGSQSTLGGFIKGATA